MSYTLKILDLSIVIAVRQHNPTVLTPAFLQYSEIVPADWEVARPPVLSQMGAQVIYKNGVSIVAQTNSIAFSERVANKAKEAITVANLASKYIKVLPQVDYQAIKTNFRGHISFGKENTSAVKDYLFQQLLSPQVCQQANQPLQAGLQLMYRLEDAQLSLEISEAGLIVEKSIEPVLVFNGSFSRSVKGKEGDKLAILDEIIHNWQKDWDSYANLVNSQFLSLVDRALLSMSA